MTYTTHPSLSPLPLFLLSISSILNKGALLRLSFRQSSLYFLNSGHSVTYTLVSIFSNLEQQSYYVADEKPSVWSKDSYLIPLSSCKDISHDFTKGLWCSWSETEDVCKVLLLSWISHAAKVWWVIIWTNFILLSVNTEWDDYLEQWNRISEQ